MSQCVSEAQLLSVAQSSSETTGDAKSSGPTRLAPAFSQPIRGEGQANAGPYVRLAAGELCSFESSSRPSRSKQLQIKRSFRVVQQWQLARWETAVLRASPRIALRGALGSLGSLGLHLYASTALELLLPGVTILHSLT